MAEFRVGRCGQLELHVHEKMWRAATDKQDGTTAHNATRRNKRCLSLSQSCNRRFGRGVIQQNSRNGLASVSASVYGNRISCSLLQTTDFAT